MHGERGVAIRPHSRARSAIAALFAAVAFAGALPAIAETGLAATFTATALEGSGCFARHQGSRGVARYGSRIEVDGDVVAIGGDAAAGPAATWTPDAVASRAHLRIDLPGQRCTASGEVAIDAAPARPRDLDALVALENASRLYARAEAKLDEGRAGEAAREAAEALALRTRILGDDHVATLASAVQSLWARARTRDKAPAGDYAALERRIAEAPGGLDFLAAGVRHARALSLYDAGDLAAAARETEAAIAARTRVLGPDHIDTLASRALFAVIRDEQGATGAAVTITEDVLARRTRVLGPRHAQTFGSLNNLASLYEAQGRLGDALAMYARAAAEGEVALGADSPFVQDAAVNLAGIELALGRTSDALRRLERVRRAQGEALGIAHPRTARTTMSLGEAYAGLGRFDDALAILRAAQAAALRAQGETSPLSVALAFRIADLLRVAGRPDEARPLAERVLAARTKALGAAHPQTLAAMTLQANIAWASGDFVAAREGFERTIAAGTAARGADDADVLFNRYQLALLDAEHGSASIALPAIRDVRARQSAKLGPAHPRTLNSRALEGRLLAATGESRVAQSALEEVVAAAERRREEGASLAVENRQSLYARYASSYALLARLRAGAGDRDGAFALSEQAKARTLQETLAQRRGDASRRIPDADRERLAEFDARAARLTEAISRARGDAEATLRLAAERNAIVHEAATARARLRERYPAYARMSAVPQLTPTQGAALLAPGTAFASYLVDGDAVLAFTLSRERGLRAVDLGAIAGLAETVASWRALALRGRDAGVDPTPVWRLPSGAYVRSLSRPDPRADRATDANEIARLLSRRLLDPLAELAPASRWIVSPDGALAFLPFEILSFRGRPVAPARRVSYIQSLGVLALVDGGRGDRAANRKSLLAFGAPDYEGALARSGATAGTVWRNLPGARRELAFAAASFARAERDLVIGGEATKATLVAMNRSGALAGYRRLLFAAHARLDARSPELSALVLGRSDPDDPADGEVTAAEWSGFDLASDLVVLSGCETALGREIRGEGVTGLPYALYVAGNRSSVLTLWKVGDAATAEFVRRFFARIAVGEGETDALAAVKREFRGDPRWSDPFFWAPFVLYGGV